MAFPQVVTRTECDLFSLHQRKPINWSREKFYEFFFIRQRLSASLSNHSRRLWECPADGLHFLHWQSLLLAPNWSSSPAGKCRTASTANNRLCVALGLLREWSSWSFWFRSAFARARFGWSLALVQSHRNPGTEKRLDEKIEKKLVKTSENRKIIRK